MPPQIRNPRQLDLPQQGEAVLAEMFQDCQEVILRDDFTWLGYSGSWVYRVHLLRGGGSPELPLVVKIAPASLIAREVQAYQECVHNQWPGIAELRGEPIYLEGSDLGGLCYPLMGGGVFRMQSLREYCLEASTEDVCFVLRERLLRIMQERTLLPARNVFEHPLRASYDRVLPVNLLVVPRDAGQVDENVGQTHGPAPMLIAPDALPRFLLRPGDVVRVEGFVVSEVNPRQRSVTLNVPADKMRDAYRLRLCPVGDLSAYAVGEVMPPAEGIVRETRQSLLYGELVETFGPSFNPACETVTLPDEDGSRVVLPNPLLAIPEILAEVRHVKVNAIHGDLNLENVLVDPQVRDVRLIDFAEARQDCVLHDLLRLETEVVTKLLPAVLEEAGLSPEAIVPLYRQLHSVMFPSDTGQASGLVHPALEKLLAILSEIHQAACYGVYDRDDYLEYYRGLILYMLGALKFHSLVDERGSSLPKQVAFLGAATLQGLASAECSPDEARRAVMPPLSSAIASGERVEPREIGRRVTVEPVGESAILGRQPGSIRCRGTLTIYLAAALVIVASVAYGAFSLFGMYAPSEEKANATATQIAANIFATQTAEVSTPTRIPTNALVPTATQTPTRTPMSFATPTATATATHTPTATPVPTSTPTPTPTEMATPTPTPESVTLYYVSNPNDILGVFPVYPFDGEAMYNNMLNMRESLTTMQNSLHGASTGDANSCNAYVAAYDVILNSGVFYDDVPGHWEEIDYWYVACFIYSLDRTRPAYLSCKDSGRVDKFNSDLAWQTISETMEALNYAIDEAAARLQVR